MRPVRTIDSPELKVLPNVAFLSPLPFRCCYYYLVFYSLDLGGGGITSTVPGPLFLVLNAILHITLTQICHRHLLATLRRLSS